MSHGTRETRTETRDHGGLLKWLALEDTPTVLMNFAPHIRKSQPPDQYLISYHMVGVTVSTSTLGCSTAQLASLLPQVAGSQNNWPSISHTP